MNEMTVQIVAQYVRNVFATAHVRPYENKSALSNAITGRMSVEPLPEEHHWRVEVELTVQGANADNVLCFETGCQVEAIVFAAGLQAENAEAVLTEQIAGLLVGNVRAALTTASLSTGYGPVMVPPIAPSRLTALLNNTREAEST